MGWPLPGKEGALHTPVGEWERDILLSPTPGIGERRPVFPECLADYEFVLCPLETAKVAIVTGRWLAQEFRQYPRSRYVLAGTF